ncbi:hypothetical protein RF11_05840 [Thelohanellus kitauei]|uniref:Uncharacterized protein n=1 Tax=Thelohanellus kitauei TaxID=669202 RepID=A0A0C2M258_THEKT|nr:hypothetical protein RF11_05840 [Thelohanellus kitauei]
MEETHLEFRRQHTIANPFMSTNLIAAKNISFGKSNINRTFFYADSNLKILSAQPIESNEFAIPKTLKADMLYVSVEDIPYYILTIKISMFFGSIQPVCVNVLQLIQEIRY